MTVITACGREPLIDAIVRFFAREYASALSEIRVDLVRAIDESGPDAIERPCVPEVKPSRGVSAPRRLGAMTAHKCKMRQPRCIRNSS